MLEAIKSEPTIIDERIANFLSKHGICSLTTLLPDGSPHAAALHFSHSAGSFEFTFLTKKSSRKAAALLDGSSVRGAIVVGFSEEELITLQLDGEVAVITGEAELEDARRIHFSKHPSSKKYEKDPAYIFLKFTPSWWRYTDYNTKPATILAWEEQQ
jgi:general stress protein 26